MVLQLVAAVWWAATITTKMNFVLDATVGTRKNLDEHVIHDLATFSTKADLIQAITTHEKEIASSLILANRDIAAMWKKIDAIIAK